MKLFTVKLGHVSIYVIECQMVSACVSVCPASHLVSSRVKTCHRVSACVISSRVCQRVSR